MEHVRAARGVGAFRQVLDDDERVTGLALGEERAGEAELQLSVVGRQSERVAVLLLGLGGEAALEQRLAEVPPQREVVGRALDRLAKRLQLVHARQDGVDVWVRARIRD